MSAIATTNNNVTPPWEVLVLVAQYLDPISLAMASCVSKSWSICFSSHHLWDPLCATHFPSLSAIISATVSSRRLYSLGYTARHRLRKPRPKPYLTLDRLLFALSFGGVGGGGDAIMTVVEPCSRMQRDPHGLFRFDMEVVEGKEWTVEEVKEMRVTWHVVEREWKAVFVMADDAGGKGGFVSGFDGWFSEELPSPGCCSSTMSSGLVADIRLGLTVVGDVVGHRYCWEAWGSRSGSNKVRVRVEKVSVGILSILNWRYVSLEDGLSYLQHFLPLSN